jgi:hypothetical protein
MAKVKPEINPALEALVKEQLKPKELVLRYGQIKDGQVSVYLIDEELHRVCAPIAKKFGGKGSGSGRTLQFKLEDGTWLFEGSGGWMS